MLFPRNLSNKYGKQLLDNATKTARLYVLINASKKGVYKAAETTGKFIGNKMTENCETKTLTFWESRKN